MNNNHPTTSAEMILDEFNRLSRDPELGQGYDDPLTRYVAKQKDYRTSTAYMSKEEAEAYYSADFWGADARFYNSYWDTDDLNGETIEGEFKVIDDGNNPKAISDKS